MRNLTKFIAIAVLVLSSACTKIIEVDIDAAAPMLVIEAEVYEGPGPHFVHLTNSVGIGDANIFSTISGALVTVSDDAGQSEVFAEVAAGYYESQNLVGRPGATYFLEVVVGDARYTATSTMAQPVRIDSIFNLKVDAFGQTRYPIFVQLQDPSAVRNQYRFVSYINQGRSKGSISSNDDIFNGQSAQLILQGLGADVVVGDTLDLEMQCIDAGVFEYFSSFGSAAGPGTSSAPSNPYTNIQGGGLGYFSACTHDFKRMVIR